MPPDQQSTQKRRTLPFKPPSRAAGSASTSTAGPSKAKAKPAAKVTKPATKAKKPTTKATSSKPKPAKASSSRQKPSPSPAGSETGSGSGSGSASGDTDRDSASASGSDDESEANYMLAEITHAEPEHEDVLSSEPLIPAKLLTKLVHHHFRNEKTKIAKDANSVVAKYIDVFVREAVARATYERAEAQGGAAGSGGIGDGFLEVEDLEKMAPQLAMDF
ncbi:CENP-S associating centromere protein X-domain-containing protein [Aspergillus multicolor]|uniref:CENP-S associating centromere protein X-domain-containing protein n=1 Tax=Aspergillus multicolor TaxID=41759 RepID=UPI003CCD1AF9